jgi:hypothetical protein
VPPLSPCRRPASPASRALRQLRQPRRTTCPPLRSSSSRFNEESLQLYNTRT